MTLVSIQFTNGTSAKLINVMQLKTYKIFKIIRLATDYNRLDELIQICWSANKQIG